MAHTCSSRLREEGWEFEANLSYKLRSSFQGGRRGLCELVRRTHHRLAFTGRIRGGFRRMLADLQRQRKERTWMTED